MISVIMTTYHNPAIFPEDVAANHDLRRAHLPVSITQCRHRAGVPFEFIIVSNGDDAHHSYVQGLGGMVEADRILLNHYNGYSTHARALGAQLARGSVLVFLDDDFEFEMDWLALMLELLRRQGEERTVVSGFRWHNHGVQREGPDWVETGWPTDGCCMMARALYDRTRGYRLDDPGPRPRHFIRRILDLGGIQFLAHRPGVIRHWGRGRSSTCYRAGFVQRDAEGAIWKNDPQSP